MQQVQMKPEQPDYQTLQQQFQDPNKRLAFLTRQLKHVKRMLTIAMIPEWQEIVNTLNGAITQKNRERNSIDINDADSLAMHDKRSLYLTGFVHGAQYLLWDMAACQSSVEILEAEIKKTEQELRHAAKTSRS